MIYISLDTIGIHEILDLIGTRYQTIANVAQKFVTHPLAKSLSRFNLHNLVSGREIRLDYFRSIAAVLGLDCESFLINSAHTRATRSLEDVNPALKAKLERVLTHATPAQKKQLVRWSLHVIERSKSRRPTPLPMLPNEAPVASPLVPRASDTSTSRENVVVTDESGLLIAACRFVSPRARVYASRLLFGFEKKLTPVACTPVIRFGSEAYALLRKKLVLEFSGNFTYARWLSQQTPAGYVPYQRARDFLEEEPGLLNRQNEVGFETLCRCLEPLPVGVVDLLLLGAEVALHPVVAPDNPGGLVSLTSLRSAVQKIQFRYARLSTFHRRRLLTLAVRSLNDRKNYSL